MHKDFYLYTQCFFIYLKLSRLTLPCQPDQVTVIPSAPPSDPVSELAALAEDLDLLPQLQQLLDEERNSLQQYHPLFAPASENLISLTDQQQWYLTETRPEPLATTQDPQQGFRTSPILLHASQRAPAAEDRIPESYDLPSLNPPPSPAVAAALCLMVEDPYFDSPLSSPSSEEAPVDSTQNDKQWTLSPIFSTPSLCLNDQTLEQTSPASGKWSCVCVCVSLTPIVHINLGKEV